MGAIVAHMTMMMSCIISLAPFPKFADIYHNRYNQAAASRAFTCKPRDVSFFTNHVFEIFDTAFIDHFVEGQLVKDYQLMKGFSDLSNAAYAKAFSLYAEQVIAKMRKYLKATCGSAEAEVISARLAFFLKTGPELHSGFPLLCGTFLTLVNKQLSNCRASLIEVSAAFLLLSERWQGSLTIVRRRDS
jgi:hypothetical protein